MSQVSALLSALKQSLRAQNKTYAEVAQWLNLSEASVKRMFAQEQISLDRLELICSAMDMEISDLVYKMEAERATTTELTYQQEFEITQDLELMLVTVCVFNYWTLHDIITHFSLSEVECINKMLKLEKLGLINLMPNNRIKLRISKRFRWLENGPFEQFFRQHIGKEFFNHRFEKESHALLAINVTLPSAVIKEFKQKLDSVAKEVSEANRYYSNIPAKEKEGITMVMAMRDWDFGLFQHLVRSESKYNQKNKEG